MSKMLKRLIETKLFLNIDKCEFFVKKVKYLNLIIIIEKIKMNFQKIEIIMNFQKISLHQKCTNIFKLLQLLLKIYL